MTPLGFIDTSPLHSAGPVENSILNVYGPLFWVSVAVFVLVGGAITYAALRFRRQHDDEEPVQVHGNNRLELGWTIVPLVILLSLFVLTAANINTISSAPAGSKQVHVVGQRYNWSFFYGTHNKAGKELFSSGTMYVPAGEAVAMTVTSKDVNHSFYVPTLAGQINAIPGQTNHLWLQADQQGLYYGACTELCGDLHWTMSVMVMALPPAKFDACMTAAEAKPFPVVNCKGGA